jgi:tetratricopeptide (TPR) repeat protein
MKVAWIATLAVIATAAADAQDAGHPAFQSIPLEVLERPVPLRTGIGVAREAVRTASAEARAFYEQGLAHLHSFEWIEAARSFRTALRADPRLAVAHVGLSFAFGGLGSMDGARRALEQAKTLASAGSDRDRLRISLRGLQLDALANGGDPARSAAYRTALDAALTRDPEDVQLLLLRGEAEDASGSGSPTASGAGAVGFYQRALRAAPEQFAAHHYLVHAYESAGRIDLALAESEAYVRLAPAVPHAHHMYAHGLRRAGRTAEALAAFQTAEALALAYLKSEQINPAYDWHYHHNQTLMAGAYRYVGQLGAARQRLEPVFDTPAPLLPEELSKRHWPALLLASGSIDQALAAARRLAAHKVPLLRAAGRLQAAQIHMAAGRLEPAGLEADAALRELRAAGPEAGTLAPHLRVVQGEFLLRGGDREKGRAMIREGVRQLRADVSPDAWSETLFDIEALARAARAVGDWLLAGELAEQLRAHDPLYAGTSYALGRVAEQHGDRATAIRNYREALQRWTGADPDLADFTDARRRLAVLAPAAR